MKRIVVGISGATGVIYGVRLLEILKRMEDIETHLVLSDWARVTLELETDYTPVQVEKLAYAAYEYRNNGAAIASGSFRAYAAVILPCSMKTLSAVANGYADNLIVRSADVCIKESRTLIISPRETPLGPIHLENMLKLSRMGVKIIPPMPGFYNKPQCIDDLIDFHCMKILDALGLENDASERWAGC